MNNPVVKGWKVKLTYFKPISGKFHGCGEYMTMAKFFLDVFEEVRYKRNTGNLPGLARNVAWSDEAYFVILVESDTHPNAYPGLLLDFQRPSL